MLTFKIQNSCSLQTSELFTEMRFFQRLKKKSLYIAFGMRYTRLR